MKKCCKDCQTLARHRFGMLTKICVCFICFCEFSDLHFAAPRLATVLIFIQFMYYNGLRPASILNYVTPAKSQMRRLNCSDAIFDHARVKIMLKAMEKN